MSNPGRYWRRRKADRDEDRSSSGEPSGKTSPSTSPQTLRAKLKTPVDRKRPNSPRSSPLLRRLSTFIKQKSSSKSKLSSKAKKKLIKHEFDHLELTQPTWCDLCDDIIWGLLRPCVQCKRCMYTCHLDCADQVELACVQRTVQGPREPHVHPRQTQEGIDAGAQGLLAYLTAEDVAAKVDKYNCNRTNNFIEMLDNEPGSKNFKGYIRVTLNLTRPIRVSSDESIVNNSPEQSECLAVPVSPAIAGSSHRFFRSSGSASSSGSHEGETFFLPKHVSKGLYVTSATTAQEVIAILLRKFRVTSNPRKFALFERNTASGSERRLRRFEEPLALQLLWGEKSEHFELSLKEYNQEYEFHWEEFSLAELENFCTILDREEQAACEQPLQ
ncbi:hypothetical protein PTSG_00637 [Salpingoeca rosetta]|uniref:Uncharacterized protein n=1 Tax=Salpingoeca rosetta (strain ATCC 50818 / BSB-021) TaxID=946362 RepID=F2TX21_SALR5|nr:uncharacterized protein PTSG_00637 [Salpingoeca rosetta]EGD75930.1 hypothetical protein PTSG_00637 [Salpingoeca rosetta]|eukprot:XP_004998106.1 hypothetical protein PTSG_00637 [Salpingoeca rosetta]